PMRLSRKLLPGPDSVIRGHRDGAWFLNGIAVSQDGTLLATTQRNRGVQLWNLRTRRRLRFLPLAPHPPVTAVALGGGHRYIAAGDIRGDVTLANTAAHEPMRRFAVQSSPSEFNSVSALAISRDGHF